MPRAGHTGINRPITNPVDVQVKPLRLSLLSLLACVLPLGPVAQTDSLLVVTVTKGFRHGSIPVAEAVLEGLAMRHGGLVVDFARNDEELARKTTPEALRRYDGVIFANTTGELPLPDRDAFLEWIRAGNGFVGMHSASDTFHQYRPYIEMLGGEFRGHGPQVEVDVVNEDPAHAACAHYGAHFSIHDEIYLMKSFDRERVRGLLTLHHHPNSRVPGDHPVAWCRAYGNGRVFYTSLGHREDVWTNRDYQQHILGGILWSLGKAPGDAAPSDLRHRVSDAEREAGFVSLFNGVDLEGWKLRNPEGAASWSAQNGMLVNTVAGDARGTDLVSEARFRDFTVRFEYQVPKGSNSGFYLRGRHEIQILEGGRNDKSGNGAIYAFKECDLPVSRKAGEWQEVEATIRGEEVTVHLNGARVHDRVVVDRPTGGELDGDVAAPGPILLQGDHGAVAFRNLRIRTLD